VSVPDTDARGKTPFIVWSPVDDLFVQHVQYNMSGAISKAHSFYFNVYLPVVVSS